MTDIETKYNRLKEIFFDAGKVLIAYSGGVDSTLLLKIGTDCLGTNCIGIIGRSPSISGKEFDDALAEARKFGAHFKIIETNEFENELYIVNNSDRCYHCKNELFGSIRKIAQELKVNTIFDGSNFDDLSDTRPGIHAATEGKVRSPFIEAQIGKNEIRQLAKKLGLKTWNKPAQPCLSSRVAYGIKVEPDILSKIDFTEQVLKELGFEVVRARWFGEYISIEVGQNELSRLSDSGLVKRIKEKLKKIDLPEIRFDPDGYRQGKLNMIHEK